MANLLTGDADELGHWLAEHANIDGLDLCGAPPGAMELEREARHGEARPSVACAGTRLVRAPPGLSRMTPFLETKTV